jgi:hypothetical protein
MIRGAVQIARDLQQAELVQKLIDVQQAVLDAQGQLMAMNEASVRLGAEYEKLRKALEFRETLILDRGEQLYKLRDGDDGDHSRYCPVCLDAGDGARRLVAKDLYGEEIGRAGLEGTAAWRCAKCGSYFRRRTPLPGYH